MCFKSRWMLALGLMLGLSSLSSLAVAQDNTAAAVSSQDSATVNPSSTVAVSNTSDALSKYESNIVRMSLITVKPDKIEAYKEIVSEVGRASMAHEPGVRVLYSMQEKRDPTKFMILEIYASPEAYQYHIQTPHFKKYKDASLDMVTFLDLVDCNPLVAEALIKP